MNALTNVTKAVIDTSLSDTVGEIGGSFGAEITDADENFLVALEDIAYFMDGDETIDLILQKLVHLETGEEEYEGFKRNSRRRYHRLNNYLTEWLEITQRFPCGFMENMQLLTILYPLITDVLLCKLYSEFAFEGTALQRYLDLAGE